MRWIDSVTTQPSFEMRYGDVRVALHKRSDGQRGERGVGEYLRLSTKSEERAECTAFPPPLLGR